MTVAVCDLVLEVCELVERCRGLQAAEEQVTEEVACLRVALLAALDACGDDAVRADGLGALTELDALVARLEALPVRLRLSA